MMNRRVPAEWDWHKAMWIGFPSHEDLWQDDLIAAQAEVAALVRILSEFGDEKIKLLVMGEEAHTSARTLLSDLKGLEIVDGRFGDIWLRDTGPIYTKLQEKEVLQAQGFLNNGWGGKYQLEFDNEVAGALARHDQVSFTQNDFILEGGALDHDGLGTMLTTRQCLINPNRNQGWDEKVAEAQLQKSLGAKKVIWLDDGLMNDHTDGHVDNLARFVAPGIVVCPMAYGADDPNAKIYDETARFLSLQTDVRGQSLQVVRVPSPGLMKNDEGEIVPASHMNFLIGNECVVVPVYDQGPADLAVEVLQGLFSERKVVGLSSRAILTGGGSFHCISQQVPQ